MALCSPPSSPVLFIVLLFIKLIIFKKKTLQALHPAHCLDQGGGRAAGVHRAIHPSEVEALHPSEVEAVHPTDEEAVYLSEVEKVHSSKVEEVHPPKVDEAHSTQVNETPPKKGRNKLRESENVFKSQ